MATINQLRVERNAFFRELKRAHRSVDSVGEKLERQVDQILNRKRNVPETNDYLKAVENYRNWIEALEQFERVLDSGGQLFDVSTQL